MKRSAFRSVSAAVLAVCLLVSAVQGAEEEMVDNPQYKSWAKLKPGSTVTHETSTAAAGQNIKMEATQKLVEVTAEKAVVEQTMNLGAAAAGGAAPPATKQDIPAKVKKSELNTGPVPPGVKVETKEKGKEKITVAGKSYECNVIEVTGEQNAMKMSGKIWTSEQIPSTLAKMESSTNVGGQDVKTTMVLKKIELKK